jgi:hypothetical protein
MKEIPDFSGYFVTEDGIIFSNLSGILTKKKLMFRGGYYVVSLYKRGKGTFKKKVHHLVLETFVGPKPSSKSIVRHLNDDPLDNRLVNLKWGNQKENSDDYKINSILKSDFYNFVKSKYPQVITEYNGLK